MNILYCGDKNILDGLMISVLSLMKNSSEPIKVYVLTMDYKKYRGISMEDVSELVAEMKKRDARNELKILDIGEVFRRDPVTANDKSYFTPYCMLRLYADEIPELPDKILYLDTDVVCLNDPRELTDMDNSKYELVGVLDRYGGKIFKKPMAAEKYLNSGVLLLNLRLIRETRLFKRAREMCKKRPMVMPDQTSLNFLVKYKKIVEKKFNEQREIRRDTVFRHFSNTFQFFPYFKVQKIKPWEVEKLHNLLNTHEFDDVLEQWQQLKGETAKNRVGELADSQNEETKEVK